MEQLTMLASLLLKNRIMQHARHLMFTGDLSNHELLGELYEMHEEHFDALSEKIIGLSGTVNIQLDAINFADIDCGLAAALIDLKVLMMLITQVCQMQGIDLGVQNMLLDSLDAYQKFAYKLQRIMLDY